MSTDRIYAVLLAGGKGTRLWPLSTEKYSKSFVRIGERKPLIEETVKRLRGLVERKNMLIVVDKRQEALLRKTVKEIPKKNILVEPLQRSTASAVGLAAIHLKAQDIMIVLPTDAIIQQARVFRKTIKNAVNFAKRKERALLCIGIKPQSPSTAYGYIKLKARESGDIYSVDKFIEKPSRQKAERLIKNKSYLWNGGMFVFKSGTILKAMKRHAPLLRAQLERIRKNKKNIKGAYLKMKNVSIDYQIMEKAKNLYCAKGNFGWHDLGSWRSLEALFKKDKKRNIVFGKAKLVNTTDTIVYNTGKEKLGVVGLKNMIIVSTDKGTLVCSKGQAENVKELAGKL